MTTTTATNPVSTKGQADGYRAGYADGQAGASHFPHPDPAHTFPVDYDPAYAGGYRVGYRIGYRDGANAPAPTTP